MTYGYATGEADRLRGQLLIARNRIADLETQLSCARETLRGIAEQTRLTEKERAVLAGRPDGCVRVNDLRPIVRRLTGELTNGRTA